METILLPTRQVLGFQGLSIGTVLAPSTARTLLIEVGSSCPTFGLRVFESQSPTGSDFWGGIGFRLFVLRLS